ncbi:hypothetical protein BDW59DRAFT_28171 [Aspergillus cavernicola]|uniref:Calponin-homology (CH) domain-containing protein n=1 Tax=Aspergillus cavernicola TaxID=176166 RepID=A0ABR4HE91_9EURO
MSGSLHEVGTPCPRRSKASTTGDSSYNGSDPFDSLWDDSLGNYDDDTRNLDFTTEIKAPILTGAKPKRRTRASTTTTSFVIHGDHDEKPTQATGKSKRDITPATVASNHTSSLFAQPAQRFRPRVSFAPSPLKNSRQSEGVEPTKRSTRPDAEKNNELLRRISAGSDGVESRHAVKKDIRRDTVYIPPDDTTVASVFMGLFSPLKSNNLEQYTPESTEIKSLESQIARKRHAKRSLASSPDRVLQPSSKVTQESCIRADVPGRNGGKENIPPGMGLVGIKGKYLQPTKLNEVSDKDASKSVVGDIPPSANAVNKPLAARTANTSVQKKMVDGNFACKTSVSSVVNGRRTLKTKTKDAIIRSSTLSNPLKTSRSVISPVSRNNLKRLDHEYPMVSESITNPALYDDNWLSHQEVILTQLINGLFDHTSSALASDSAILRHELLALYQSAYFTEVHQRLQASLMYGALSIPRDVLVRNSRLRYDLGMKRKFIDIWLQTYDSNALKAALETVTGRTIPVVKATSTIRGSAGDPALHIEKALKKRLGNFLHVFLIQNQDLDGTTSEPIEKDPDALGRAYRRTVLRSVMIVILLDKARLSPKTPLSRCLFLPSSPHKSSLAVLQALARFLLPSCGDINKALGQLDCQVRYHQHPLEEYGYKLSNLAVDLRDGVRLTRIVELLLYPSTCPQNISCDTTLIETTLSDSANHYQWPLSQRLKFPYVSRAVKMFNVRTALTALASTKEGRQLINIIRPEDIVDGHREKTLALLWGLVSKWGLSGLLDLDDLRKEIAQLKQRATSLHELEAETEVSVEHGEDEPAALLKQWASLVAQLRGLQPEELKTNLGDGKVYECILDEYEGYILYPTPNSTSQASKASLEDRLRSLGCSTQFIDLVSPNRTHILDTNSTTGALAFLCSRLLPTTKRVRAATVLQNAWRRVLNHRETQRRVVVRDIARQCAAVVQARDRILWAKGVILHWWRMSRSRRQRTVVPKRSGLGLGLDLTRERKSVATTTRIPLRRGKRSSMRV